jgi:uncharacterized protein
VADIYLDACCFIYLVEGQPEWRTVVEQRLRNLEPLSKLLTSQLARLECRTKPMREGNQALLERYDTLFGARGRESHALPMPQLSNASRRMPHALEAV